MKKHISLILLGSFFLLIIFLSWYGGLISEDIWHCNARSYSEAYSIALQSYQNTNARIGELLLYFVGVSKDGAGFANAIWFYRIANPIFITASLLFIFRLAIGRWPTNNKIDVISLLFAALCLLSNKTGYYWLCSNVNWFYPTVVALLFFIAVEPFFSMKQIGRIRYIIALCCAPIVGMSNEVVSMVSLVLYFSIYFWSKRQIYAIDKRYLIIGGVLLVFGLLFYTAPGPYKRVESVGEMNDVSKLEYVFSNFFSLNWLHVLFWSWRLILVFVLMILCFYNAFKYIKHYLMISVVILSGGILMLAPAFGAPRALIPVEIALMILMTAVFYKAFKCKLVNRVKLIFIFSIMSLCSLTVIIPNAVRSIDGARLYSILHQKIFLLKQSGKSHLILKEDEIMQDSIWQVSSIRFPRTLLEIYPLLTDGYPVIKTSQEHFKKSLYVYEYARFPYNQKNLDFSGTDCALNRGLAKYFGIETIIVVRSTPFTKHWK